MADNLLLCKFIFQWSHQPTDVYRERKRMCVRSFQLNVTHQWIITALYVLINIIHKNNAFFVRFAKRSSQLLQSCAIPVYCNDWLQKFHFSINYFQLIRSQLTRKQSFFFDFSVAVERTKTKSILWAILVRLNGWLWLDVMELKHNYIETHFFFLLNEQQIQYQMLLIQLEVSCFALIMFITLFSSFSGFAFMSLDAETWFDIANIFFCHFTAHTMRITTDLWLFAVFLSLSVA